MNLTQEEIDWLRLAIEDNYNYCVSVDNDCVFIDKRINDDMWDDWNTFLHLTIMDTSLLFNYLIILVVMQN